MEFTFTYGVLAILSAKGLNMKVPRRDLIPKTHVLAAIVTWNTCVFNEKDIILFSDCIKILFLGYQVGITQISGKFVIKCCVTYTYENVMIMKYCINTC